MESRNPPAVRLPPHVELVGLILVVVEEDDLVRSFKLLRGEAQAQREGREVEWLDGSQLHEVGV